MLVDEPDYLGFFGIWLDHGAASVILEIDVTPGRFAQVPAKLLLCGVYAHIDPVFVADQLILPFQEQQTGVEERAWIVPVEGHPFYHGYD